MFNFLSLKKSDLEKIIWWLGFIGPIFIFFFLVFRYSYDFPKDDDFDSPINSALEFFSLESWKDKLSSVLQFHSDHRLAVLRCFSIVHIYIFGTLNFKAITLYGIVLLVPIYLMLIYPLIKKKHYLSIIPSSYLVFNLSYESSLMWAHSSMNYTPVLFCTIISIYFASVAKFNTNNFILSFLFCVLGSLSYGNGILAFVVVIIILIIRIRKWTPIVTWLFLSIGFIWIYFSRYERAGYLGAPNAYLENVLIKVQGLFVMSGGYVYLNSGDIKQSSFLGLLIIASLIYIIWVYRKSILKEGYELFYLGVIAFILGTVFLLAVGRLSDEASLLTFIQNRYKFYSIFLLTTVYLLFSYIHRIDKMVVFGIITLVVCYNFYSFFLFKNQLDFNHKSFLTSSYNWKNNGRGLSYYWDMQDQASSIMKAFEKEDLFRTSVPSYFIGLDTDLNVGHTELSIRKDSLRVNFGNKAVDIMEVLLFENDFEKTSDLHHGVYFIFKSERQLYIFPASQNINPGKNFLKNGKGVSGSINEEHLAQGEYEIFCLYLLKNGQKMIKKTDKKIWIGG